MKPTPESCRLLVGEGHTRQGRAGQGPLTPNLSHPHLVDRREADLGALGKCLGVVLHHALKPGARLEDGFCGVPVMFIK